MEECATKLENAYYRNVLNIIEEALVRIPNPAHIVLMGKYPCI